MTLGRKPEAIDTWRRYLERGEKDHRTAIPVGTMGTFNRPTDIAWDRTAISTSATATAIRASSRSPRTASG